MPAGIRNCRLRITSAAAGRADAADLTAAYNPGYTYWTDFLFQGMFAATAATIVSVHGVPPGSLM